MNGDQKEISNILLVKSDVPKQQAENTIKRPRGRPRKTAVPNILESHNGIIADSKGGSKTRLPAPKQGRLNQQPNQIDEETRTDLMNKQNSELSV